MRLPNQVRAVARNPSVNSETGAIQPSGCSFLKQAACATAIASCGAICYASLGAACVACLGAVGQPGCYECF